MKKIVLLILIISLMATVFAGCGEEVEAPESGGNDEPVIDTTTPETEPPVETPDNTEVAKPEDKPVEKPADTDTTKPSTPSTKPVEKPATTPEKPADTPASKPQDAPVMKEYSLSEVHTIIKNTYGEDYRPNVEIPKESLKDLFGINLDDVDDFIAEQPMISANIDTFIAIKAKTGKGEYVANALNTYKTNFLDVAIMYPSNVPKAQAAKVVRHGDFVFLVMLGAAGDMEADEETQINFAKAQVEKGVNAINSYFTK